jgi:small subunit ribosomal protein S17e
VQEEERERRLDFVPDKSKVDIDAVEITADAEVLLKNLGLLDALQNNIRLPEKEAPQAPQTNTRQNQSRNRQ